MSGEYPACWLIIRTVVAHRDGYTTHSVDIYKKNRSPIFLIFLGRLANYTVLGLYVRALN